MLQGTPSPKACLNNLVRKIKLPHHHQGDSLGPSEKKSHSISCPRAFPHPGCGRLSHHPSCTGHPLCSLPVKGTSRALRVLASQGHVPTAHGRLWGAQRRSENRISLPGGGTSGAREGACLQQPPSLCLNTSKIKGGGQDGEEFPVIKTPRSQAKARV